MYVSIVHHNYISSDALVIVAISLGIQLAKSRICAILLIAYGCLNTIYYFLSTGKFAGYILILVGFLTIKPIFRLHKEYQQFLLTDGISRPQSSIQQNEAQRIDQYGNE